MPSGDHTWPGLTLAPGSAKDHTQRGLIKTSHGPRPVPRDVPQAFPLLQAPELPSRVGGRQAAEAGCTWLPGYSRCHRDAIRM